MESVRIGVVGVGHLGRIHARLWKEQKQAQLVGVYDVDRRLGQQVAAELHVQSFPSFEALLQEVDAVVIVTPTTTHYQLAAMAIQEGKHCFVEKPIAASYAEARALARLAANAQVVLQVGHIERFNPALQVLSRYELAPVFIEVHRLAPFKPRSLDVSVVFDLMIHDLDILLWLLKRYPVDVIANGVAVLTSHTDIANARLVFDGHIIVNLTASRLSKKVMRKMRIFQEGAYFSLDFADQRVEVYRLVPKDAVVREGDLAKVLGSIEYGTEQRTIVYEIPEAPQGNPLFEEQRTFIQAICSGAAPAVSAAEAAQALRLAEDIERAIARHQQAE